MRSAPVPGEPARRTPGGFLGLPLAVLMVGAAAAAILFSFAERLGFGLSLIAAMIALLSVAAALFLTIPELPRDRPVLRRATAVILAAGGTTVLLLTPFGALAMVALASR